MLSNFQYLKVENIGDRIEIIPSLDKMVEFQKKLVN